MKTINDFLDKIKNYIYSMTVILKIKLYSKYVLLLGNEDFGNLGDHHIAVSESEFIRKYFPEYRIIEIPASKCGWMCRKINKYVKSDTVIFINGGGNIGDIYYSEKIRQEIFELFPANKKIIFPQTIYFQDMCSEMFMSDLKYYTSGNKVFLFCREQYSKDFAVEHFECKTYLCPDIVLFSDYPDKTDRDAVTFCIRHDTESAINRKNVQKLMKMQKNCGRKVRFTDTQLQYNVSVNNRKKVLNNFLVRLSSSKVVVTDRLHGMIFSYITHTPCLVFPNYNKKVSGVFEWISECSYIRFMDRLDSKEDLSKADSIIDELFHMSNEEKKSVDLSEEFNKMAGIIRGIMED